jgi:hypothetical protein
MLKRSSDRRIMINDTISKIEARIASAESLSEARKHELKELLAALKTEVGGLSQTHRDEAQSIAGFAEVSTHEATRAEPNPQLLDLSLQGLAASAQGFEQSHPKLVRAVNTISQTLSNLGI